MGIWVYPHLIALHRETPTPGSTPDTPCGEIGRKPEREAKLEDALHSGPSSGVRDGLT